MPDQTKKDTAVDRTEMTDEDLTQAAGGGHFWVFSSATTDVENVESRPEGSGGGTITDHDGEPPQGN